MLPLPCKKSEASFVLPPRRGERGGWEKGLGDEGENVEDFSLISPISPISPISLISLISLISPLL